MLLEYQNLKIRNATADDAKQLAIWWNDGAIMDHAGFPNGLGKTADSIAESLKSDSDDSHRRLMVEVNQMPIGEMNFHNRKEGTAGIGIKICDSSRQEKGIGRMVLSMLISSLFHDLGYKRIYLDTDLNNRRAQHVYEKLGFRKIRVNENAWKDQLGELRSTVEYELYEADFVDFTKV